MVVKIVTDSTSDISPEIAQALGITVVPVYVRFGEELYRDGVDISNEEFYDKLANSLVHPKTSQPTPQDFARVYSDCSKEAEGIVSIHISAKISGTYNAALQGKKMTKGKCQIEVVDSLFTSVGLALVVMAAARLARAGDSLQSVLDETRKAISQTHMLGIFETMKYLVLGGRLSQAAVVVASILQIKPLLTFRDGEVIRGGLVHTYSQGVERLFEFAENNLAIQDLAIAYSAASEQVYQLKVKLRSIFPEEKIYLAELGAGLGVHSGPGALILALRQKE
ncbi:DegV family protein [Chloroflexota bacterium]